jgi:two-component sensor histidine kinase
MVEALPAVPPERGEADGSIAYARAVLNILEDFADEKKQLQAMQRAVLNILEDFLTEKARLEQMKEAVLNILDDLAIEKSRLEQTQKEVIRSERAVRASLREKETLLKEVHHRVKNNLQVISSLLNLQSRHLTDEASRTLLEESQDRVHSIALVHETLYQSGDLAQIEFSEYLSSLVAHLTNSWGSEASGVRISVEASGVRLPVDVAIPCGLIVNELVTNSFKHAFPHTARGTVAVRVSAAQERRIRLVVSDDGVGLPEKVDVAKSGSLGLELVAALARQLRASVQVTRQSGTTFELRFEVAE